MPRDMGTEAVNCRRRGVLLHISSLPSEYGTGTFGRAAYRFIDMLTDAGANLWAFLPIGPTGYGDSPYQCFSSFALNPYFLDLDMLCRKGVLTKDECGSVNWGARADECDHGALFRERLPLLMTAYARAVQREGFEEELAAFESTHPEVADYALFTAIKDYMGGKPWYEWPEPLKMRDPEAIKELWHTFEHERDFCLYIQKELFEQWDKLHAYARRRGVALMGDMPIYCAYDSADCWCRPEAFRFDGSLAPTAVAGVPPDYFCELGQKWGNPLYDWEKLRRMRYDFWIGRMTAAARLFDVLRIDHFRGFEAYYAIPADSPDARVGEWHKGCGYGLFKRFKEMQDKGEAPRCEIVAEDLGFITPNVKRLLTRTGFAGMQVLEFAFGGGKNNPHRPGKWDGAPEHVNNKYCYTGTHDNPPLAEWWQGIETEERVNALRWAGLDKKKDRKLIELLSRAEAGPKAAELLASAAVACDARGVLIPMQDILGLGAGTRMNSPGTDSGNWRWRATKAQMRAAGKRMKTLFAESDQTER